MKDSRDSSSILMQEPGFSKSIPPAGSRTSKTFSTSSQKKSTPASMKLQKPLTASSQLASSFVSAENASLISSKMASKTPHSRPEKTTHPMPISSKMALISRLTSLTDRKPASSSISETTENSYVHSRQTKKSSISAAIPAAFPSTPPSAAHRPSGASTATDTRSISSKNTTN